MFDLIHKHKRLVQLMLALMVLPFAFWGIDSYQRGGGTAQDLAKVAGQNITLQEFSQAQREQQERLRALLGRDFDASLLDTPEQRAELLDQLIQQRLLVVHTIKSNLVVTDEQLLRHCRARLAAYQVPVRIVRLPALPRNAMGKLVRGDLLELLGSSGP